MAPRRPKNPFKDIGNQVGSWLGGAARVYADITDSSRDDQPGRLPQVQAALNATRAIGKVVDAATGGFGSALVSDAQRMAKTGSSTPSALYKTAAVNLAAGAVGAGAAKVAGKAIQTGIPRRATRAVTGRKTSYFAHGSPTTGIKKLDPKYETMPDKLVSDPPFAERWPGGVANPSQAGIYGYPITKAAGQKGSSNILMSRSDVVDAIKDSYRYSQGGSLYIAKAPRSKVGYDSDEIISSVSRVVQEIRTSGKTADQVAKETQAALKKLGFRYPKVPKKK